MWRLIAFILFTIPCAAQDVYVQWTLKTAKGWEKVRVVDWDKSPYRPIPVPGEWGAKDDIKGWVFALKVGSLVFQGYDHYSLHSVSDGSFWVSVWNDEEKDARRTDKAAKVCEFESSPSLFSCTLYLENLNQPVCRQAECRPWREFSSPPTRYLRHGVWVSQALYSRHMEARGR